MSRPWSVWSVVYNRHLMKAGPGMGPQGNKKKEGRKRRERRGEEMEREKRRRGESWEERKKGGEQGERK